MAGRRALMKAVFDDPQFSFQMLRALGGAVSGASDIGECLSTGYRIKEGDFESWHDEWRKTAERIHEYADDCAMGADRVKARAVSAREAYLRASNYYRLAEFYLHGDPADPRIEELSTRSMVCFTRFLRLGGADVEMVEIPYEDTTLPGHYYPADDSGEPKPTLIVQTGFDGTIEELYGNAAGAVARGMNCLAFEGPGQGQVIRKQGLTFRPDWEKVVTPVVDLALTLPGVDPDRVALMGISFGGYLAPRAAAFEHRLAACIADGGVYDFVGSRVPANMSREDFLGFIKSDPESFEKGVMEMAKTKPEIRWGIQNGMYTFGANSPGDWFIMCADYTLDGVADKITCPTLVIDSEADQSFPGQAKPLYDALKCPKTWMLFTAEEGAEEHCQVGAGLISGERIFNWLQDTLAGIDRT
jgi:pimeloyl-ACP methyl ester carboxylesterase